MKKLITLILLSSLFFSVVLFTIVFPSPKTEEEPIVYNVVQPEALVVPGDQDILDQINNYRIQNSLNKLTVSPVLCDFAEKRAVRVDKYDDGHEYFLIDGPLLADKNRYTRVYENIFIGDSDPVLFTSDLIVTMWIDSPTHNENLLRKKTTIVCVKHSDDVYVFISAY